ncbi:hydroxymethylglutaryl-CoA reductase [Lewinella lacunae]|uniref:hydroxymethylglutaryl-CoA reductase (NADPH) n=2 Tax=Neolewinella lacunae TaxID=1517758 RepID=A0A923PET2_9BACT|nr:hydroxymethylglutaryl-CoA reductase [Neolewinella lacunae]
MARLAAAGHALPHLRGERSHATAEDLRGNIENFMGMAAVPVGLAGPLRMRGQHAHGDYLVPLATTEGALVASYSRGMKAITDAGGATARILAEGVQRAPYFRLADLAAATRFVAWVASVRPTLEAITAQTSRYAQLQNIIPFLEGNAVTLLVEFTTGDAAGQNMVTICTDRLCQFFVAESPEKIEIWYIEANAGGDKKVSQLSYQRVRGKKVSVEVVIPRDVVAAVLKTTPRALADFSLAATYGSVQSGTMGVQAHFANGLAALFIACGQDAACVAEAAVGTVRLEITASGDLYACATLPNLIVGTVGGGTGLPTQRECLELMDCFGAGKAGRLAEITAAVCLAGELSILSALAEGHFTSAHEALGRK